MKSSNIDFKKETRGNEDSQFILNKVSIYYGHTYNLIDNTTEIYLTNCTNSTISNTNKTLTIKTYSNYKQ